MLSQQNRALLLAYDRGYKIVDGDIISGYSGNKLKGYKHERNGVFYYTFNIRLGYKKFCPVNVHRLVAYQKYKDRIFETGIVVRHLDGDSLNNKDANITIGSQSDNMYDRDPEDLMAHSIKAATKLRRFTDIEILEIRAYRDKGYTYAEVMKHFNISSTGSLFNYLNNDYVTKLMEPI